MDRTNAIAGPGPSSASSSVNLSSTSRADQVVHRVYLKTVSVLTEARLTHFGGSNAAAAAAVAGVGAAEKDMQVKQDRWFNLVTPDLDVHKEDLQLYRAVSSFPIATPIHAPRGAVGECTIPPLLVAFVLDTSDIPSGQALLWNRTDGEGGNGGTGPGIPGARVPLDPLLGRQAGGKEGERRSGIVLERWTFQARCVLFAIFHTTCCAVYVVHRLLGQ